MDLRGHMPANGPCLPSPITAQPCPVPPGPVVSAKLPSTNLGKIRSERPVLSSNSHFWLSD
ncbi:hypothetical protein BDV97DRAFT_344766 [Delphinella strobiligena]|nr:hypothetical protein BDV97DRAFT_344766 [Delphinella strobiligena]